jgi:hypothetical protein
VKVHQVVGFKVEENALKGSWFFLSIFNLEREPGTLLHVEMNDFHSLCQPHVRVAMTTKGLY